MIWAERGRAVAVKRHGPVLSGRRQNGSIGGGNRVVGGARGLDVAQHLVDDGRMLDAGDYLHHTATVLTGFDVDPEHAFETSGPRHES